MKRRILICLLIMLSFFSLTSCKENENNQNEEPERKTEYMIKDDNLIATWAQLISMDYQTIT